MSNDEILIIYRHNNFYNDISNFLYNFIDINEYKISLYNFTKEVLDDNVFTTVTPYDVSDSESSVSDTINFFYNDNLNNYCLIFDSCIKYHSSIILKNLLYDKDTFIKIRGGKCDAFFILGKRIHCDNTNIILNYSYNYCDEDDILLLGTIDSEYLNNLDDNSTLYVYILKYLLDIKFDSDALKPLPLKDREQYYRSLLQILLVSPQENTIKLLLRLLKSKHYNTDILYLLISQINEVPDFIIERSAYNIILEKIESLLKTSLGTRGVLRFQKVSSYKKCIDFIIEYNMNSNFFDIYSIPKCCNTDLNKSIIEYYPILTTGKIIKTSPPYKINKNMTLLAKNIYGLNDNILSIKQDKIIYNDTEIPFDNKNGILVSYSHNIVYLYTQMDPIIIYSITPDNKLEIVEDGIFNYSLPNYKLIGNIVNYMGVFIGLVMVENSSYRLLLLDNHTLDCIELSRNFNITKGEALGLTIEKDNIYILGEFTEDEASVIYKQPICSEVLFLGLTNIFNIIERIKLKVSDKNNIFLNIPGWEYDAYTYDNFIFSKGTNYDINATYNPQTKILRIDDKIKYEKQFIYFPTSLENNEKTHEIYFHSSAKETLLYDKVQELNISTSENYNNAKYFIINQNKLETLTSLELSDIINTNTLIISLIDEKQLRNHTLVNNYTTSKLLTKLFLFNIVKNDTYIEFIFDKIIHKEEYDDRKNFMAVDKEYIFNNASIYKNIIDLYKSTNNIDIELSDKDTQLCLSIKSKILNKLDPIIYKNILNICKFIIANNYNAQILFKNELVSEYRKIYDVLCTLNWLKDISTNIVPDTKYDIIIINNQEEMLHIKLNDDGIIYILESNILLKI